MSKFKKLKIGIAFASFFIVSSMTQFCFAQVNETAVFSEIEEVSSKEMTEQDSQEKRQCQIFVTSTVKFYAALFNCSHPVNHPAFIIHNPEIAKLILNHSPPLS